MRTLRLEASGFEDTGRWRWVLSGPGGTFLADHDVRLDTSRWEFEAFSDLQSYLRWHTAPDRRLEQEAEVAAAVGAWAGAELLGPVADVLAAQRPAAVRVVVRDGEPAPAGRLLFYPLELAHAGGRPLAAQGVTLVMQPGRDDVTDVAPVGRRLRVLGLFSLPAGGRPLNLRRERQALASLFSELAGSGRAVDVRVLQYGVTRERLTEVLEEAEGWDVIHVSGHGLPGELELETADGSADPVTSAELVELLAAAGERVKLVSVSACWSAAMSLAEQRRLLRLPPPAAGGGPPGVRDAGGPPAAPGRDSVMTDATGAGAGSLAAELAQRLGCAVLAMRFPVVDGFAIGLAGRLYRLIAEKGQPVARAVGIALADPKLVPAGPTLDCPALSVATPALFGARAVNLTLAAPASSTPVSYETSGLRLASFPPQPERFVGRTAVMARASTALAPRSGASGVLLHGMPGAGKTACALELAYTHEDAFEAMAWFKAPDEGHDIADALSRFALTLETSLPGLRLIHLLGDEAKLAAFLPGLTALMERHRILIVVDNAESLLTEHGEWRDAQWAPVIAALAGHSGLGRLVVTSRRAPAALDRRMVTLGVDALSLDEALLLARELPHLAALIDGTLTGIGTQTARELAAGVLEIAQGHPKLLELADGQAAHPGRLRALVAAGGTAWRESGGLPAGFFAHGESSAGAEDFLQVLAAWTAAAAGTLTPPALDLFCFLCCLEEPDRVQLVLDGNWAGLWRRLDRGGPVPALDVALGELAAAGLTAQPAAGAAGNYGVHPGVAAAGRNLAGDDFRKAADTGLAAFWFGMARMGEERETKQRATRLIIMAGLNAAPYLLRLQAWDQARTLLEQVMSRDESRATAAAVLPALRAVVVAVADTDDEPAALNALARALALLDPLAGEQQMVSALATALARQNYWAAAVAAGNLTSYSMAVGRFAQPLRFAEDGDRYARQAGLGPWTQFTGQIQRLQVLLGLGRAQQVLDEAQRLRGEIDRLPAVTGPSESIHPWSARELLLDVGAKAAALLGRWTECLELHAAGVASMRSRGAPVAGIARTQVNAYGPLLRLGRADEAVALLVACREVFERAHDIRGLGTVLSALADAEDKRGHSQVAVGLERDALRYKYLTGEASSILVSHHNLADWTYRVGDRSGLATVHYLAAALLGVIIGAEGAESLIRATARAWSVDSTATMPADVAGLCAAVGQVPGVRLDRLLTSLVHVPGAADQAFIDLTDGVRAEAAAERTPDMAKYLAFWDPVIAGLVAASRGDADAARAVRTHLDRCADSAGWVSLVQALARILDGGHEELTTGLDGVGTAVATRAADAVAGRLSVAAPLGAAMELGPLLGAVTAAARNHASFPPWARHALDALAEDPGLAGLAAAFEQILGGDHDPALASTLANPVEQAAVACVLEHVTSPRQR